MPDASPHPAAAHQHTAPTGFIRKHIFSLDHKVIGKQYYGLALVAVFVGMILSWLMRIHLAYPNWPIPLDLVKLKPAEIFPFNRLKKLLSTEMS